MRNMRAPGAPNGSATNRCAVSAGRRWYPRAYFNAPAKHGNHRALADIRESIEELRYYRAAVFVPPPGPGSSEAKELAQQHGGSLSADATAQPAPEADGGQTAG